MNRSRWICVVLTIFLLLQSGASAAIGLAVVGPTSAVIAPGETVTIELSLTAPSSPATPELYGLAASVHGYGSGLQFVSGLAVPSFFSDICVAPGVCLGGLANMAGEEIGSPVFPLATLRDLRESEAGALGMRVQIALASSQTPVSNFSLLPQGIDGEFGTPMFQVIYQGVLPGRYDLLIDSSYEGDGVDLGGGLVGEIDGATYSVVVTPEPGTAVLLGLGLAGLGAHGRSATTDRRFRPLNRRRRTVLRLI